MERIAVCKTERTNFPLCGYGSSRTWTIVATSDNNVTTTAHAATNAPAPPPPSVRSFGREQPESYDAVYVRADDTVVVVALTGWAARCPVSSAPYRR